MDTPIVKVYPKDKTDFKNTENNNGLGAFELLRGVETKKGFEEWSVDVDLPLEARALVFPGEIIAVRGKEPKYTELGWNRERAQYFRIDEVKKTRGRLNVRAHHIQFDAAYSVFVIPPDHHRGGNDETAGDIFYGVLSAHDCDRQPLFRINESTTDTTLYTDPYFGEGTYVWLELLKAANEVCGEAVNISFDGIECYITDRDKTAKKLTYGKDIVDFKVTDSADESYDRIYPFDENGLTIDEGYIDSSGATTTGVRRSKIITFTLGDSITDPATRKQLLYQEAKAAVEAASSSKVRYDISIDNSVLLEVGDYVEIWDPLVVNTNDGEVEAMTPMVVTGYEFDLCRQCMKSVTFGDLPSAVSRAQTNSVTKIIKAEAK